jgi:hypothetical protein
MNLEDIMLSEISQTQKHKYCLIFFMWNLKQWNSQKQGEMMGIGVVRERLVKGCKLVDSKF